MATTINTAAVPLASMNFDWHNADFSYLANDTGQGFGTGSPLELYAAGWDFSWLPNNLPPKVSPGVTFLEPNLPEIPKGGTVTGIDTSKGWREEFDNGPGMFSRYWGDQVDFSHPGQVTIHRSPSDGDSGMMVPPTGADAGSGYGLFSMTLQMKGVIGVYGLVWPGTDVWPGPELDFVEITPDGVPYSTIHFRGGDGSNQFVSFMMPNVDETQANTYSLLWEPDRLTMYVNGKPQWTTTEHVPHDFAHGGEDLAPGIGVQTSWNAQHQNGDNWITIYDASWSPIG